MRKAGEMTGWASLFGQQLWVPHDLPEMMIGVLKIASVTTPKSILRWLNDNSACDLRLLHNGIDFGDGRYVVTNREFGGVGNAYWNPCIVSQTLARPNCEFQAWL